MNDKRMGCLPWLVGSAGATCLGPSHHGQQFSQRPGSRPSHQRTSRLRMSMSLRPHLQAWQLADGRQAHGPSWMEAAGSIALEPPGLTEQSLAINFPKMGAAAQQIPQLSKSRIIVVLLCTHTPPHAVPSQTWLDRAQAWGAQTWMAEHPIHGKLAQAAAVGGCVRPSTSAAHFGNPCTYCWCPVAQHKAQS